MKRRIPKARLSGAATDGASVSESPAAAASAAEGYGDVPVNPKDIGAELLPILSKGLYTDPFHALREYVQNAVDSGATVIRIKLTGNALTIRDDGSGMTHEGLVEARRFGVSHKNPKEHVGFRGIGIYSGYDLCDHLSITTATKGSAKQNVLEFNFGAMKKRLAGDKTGGQSATALHEIIQQHTRFRSEQSLFPESGTTVMLEDISPFHINRLRDAVALEKYILKNLPVDFDTSFPYRNEIKKFLQQNVEGFKAVRIHMEIEEGKKVVVARPTIPDLQPPVTKLLTSSTGQPIAAMWSCLHLGKDEARKGKIPDVFSDYRGFVYKLKGFTVGDNRRLQPLFRQGSGALYYWYTGEVYVVDDAVTPNTERDEFEASQAYELLQRELKGAMADLEKAALKYQAEQRAHKVLRRCKEGLQVIAGEFDADTGDRVQQFSDLNDIIVELNSQKGKLSPELKADIRAAIKQATDLRHLINRRIQQSTRRSRRRYEPVSTEQQETAVVSEDDGEDPSEEGRLEALVEEVGVELSPECATVLGLIEEALDVVLERSTCETVLREIESSLRQEFGGQ